MKKYLFPPRSTWSSILERPLLEVRELESVVQGILDEVASQGDAALLEFTERFDGVQLDQLQVSESELSAA